MNNTPWIDTKYIKFVMDRLELGEQKDTNSWIARCPICGDSHKNQYKRRFYINFNNNEYLCHCFNCDYSAPFWKFLKNEHQDLYREYQLEKLKEGYAPKQKVVAPKYSNKTKGLFEMKQKTESSLQKPIKQVKEAYDYLKYRCISDEDIDKHFFYVDDFKEFLLSIGQDEKSKVMESNPRICTTLRNLNGDVIGYQGRLLPSDKSDARRYQTIKTTDERLYFSNVKDKSKPIYIVEGIYDALMIENSIANLSSALYGLVKFLPKDLKYVLCFDNEPRHKEIMSMLKKASKHNCVVIPDNSFKKDLNETIQHGMSKETLQNKLKKLTYCPPMAFLEVTKYAKI